MGRPGAVTKQLPQGARAWRRLLAGATTWGVATLAIAVLFWWLADRWWKGNLDWLLANDLWTVEFRLSSKDDLETIVQVVSAVVIAIFVFAAGTAFVVAQVVPGSRGTRAVELLRTQHLELTVAPAMALTPASCLVLPLSGLAAASLAAALLLGSVVYLVAATLALLHILGEATSPEAYGTLLRRRYRAALRKLHPGKGSGVDPVENDDGLWYRLAAWAGFVERPSADRAVDFLYDTIRALRGWTRTAATTGDSRELHVSLETTLGLVREYARVAFPPEGRHELPSNYRHNAGRASTNPLDAERGASMARDGLPPRHAERGAGDSRSDLSHWRDWVPRSLPPTPSEAEATEEVAASGAPERLSQGPATYVDGSIPSGQSESEPHLAGTSSSTQSESAADPGIDEILSVIWVANEVGRSLVRAAELGAASTALLERDRGRLLNTFAKTARRFAEHSDMASVGVMVGYLVELGLGARRCSSDQVLWHFEPLIVLVDLHEYFKKQEVADPNDQTLHVVRVGIAAGVLKIAEAITAARIRAHHEQNGEPGWFGEPSTDDRRAVLRTVHELRQAVQHYGATWTLELPAHGFAPDTLPADLAKSPLLEPRDQPRLNAPDGALVDCLLEQLTRPPSVTVPAGNDDLLADRTSEKACWAFRLVRPWTALRPRKQAL